MAIRLNICTENSKGMKMTKKDYIKIAAVLNACYKDSINDDERLTIGAVAHELAKVFKCDNPAFSFVKWSDAIYANVPAYEHLKEAEDKIKKTI